MGRPTSGILSQSPTVSIITGCGVELLGDRHPEQFGFRNVYLILRHTELES